MKSVGWCSFDGNWGSAKSTRRVGTLASNNGELHDMHGNVWEWCEDDWHDSYEGAPLDGRAWVGSPRDDEWVFRAGSWLIASRDSRSVDRSSDRPRSRGSDLGFRIVAVLASEPAEGHGSTHDDFTNRKSVR